SPVNADTIPPSVPTGLAAAAVTHVNLSWAPSRDNVGVPGYRVFRNGTQVGTVTSTSYQDAGLAVGNTYSYTVSAYDGTISSLTIIADGNTLATCPNSRSCAATWQGKKISAETHTVGGHVINTMGYTGSSTVTISALK